MTQGGKREGAGRPPDGEQPKRTKSIKLSVDVIDYLDANPPIAPLIEKLVRKEMKKTNFPK
jgi:hypothetical protein